MKKKTIYKSKKGGAGSDWVSTVRSRGPSGVPNMSLKQFRQFTKTSDYIPNNMLAYYAAPKSTGFIKNSKTLPLPMPQGIL